MSLQLSKLTALVMITLALTLSGCETVKGFGKDIQKAGKALEKKADE